MTTHDRILVGTAVLFLLGAGARLAQPTEPPRVIWPEIPAVPNATSDRDGAQVDARVRRALEGNVFSVTRTAPAARFRIGGEQELAVDPSAAPPPPPMPDPGPPPPPRFRVAGTMLNGQGGLALIDADPAAAGPEVYRQGDAVGGYRLERIAYDHVVLVGPAGETRINVAQPGEAPRAPVAMQQRPGPTQQVPVFPKATSSADTPPGAIPPGW